MEESIDKTIEVLCNWINKQLDGSEITTQSTYVVVASMTHALAEIVSARASIIRLDRKTSNGESNETNI